MHTPAVQLAPLIRQAGPLEQQGWPMPPHGGPPGMHGWQIPPEQVSAAVHTAQAAPPDPQADALVPGWQEPATSKHPAHAWQVPLTQEVPGSQTFPTQQGTPKLPQLD